MPPQASGSISSGGSKTWEEFFDSIEEFKTTNNEAMVLVKEANTLVLNKLRQQQLVIRNQTSELNMLRSRQSVSAGLQALSFAVMFIYIAVWVISAVIKCVAKKQEAMMEEQIELLERNLQERRSKRKAAAKAVPMDK